jgi:hypothetical protein
MLSAEVDRYACTLDQLLDHYFTSDEDRWPAAHGIGLHDSGRIFAGVHPPGFFA